MAEHFNLIAGVDRLKQARILCVGDVMLDHYVYGQVERVSPEAPIPILRVGHETRTPGGAGNVLRNLQALGAQTCFVSVIGNDAAGRELNRLIAEPGNVEPHILVEAGRVTTVKTRYIAANQQMLRADRESVAPLGPYVRGDFLRLIAQAIGEHEVVIVSDYAKGVMSDGIAAAIIAAAMEAGKPVVVDPKGTDYAAYRGASVLKPNRRELALATRMPVGTEREIVAAARALIAQGGFGAILVSLSEDGMILVEAAGAIHLLAAAAREVFDVSCRRHRRRQDRHRGDPCERAARGARRCRARHQQDAAAAARPRADRALAGARADGRLHQWLLRPPASRPCRLAGAGPRRLRPAGRRPQQR